MPVRDDDDLARVFTDTYAAVIERAPAAPTLEEITTAAADEQKDVDLSHDYVLSADDAAPDEITTLPKRKRRISVVAAVAAAILLMVGVAVVVADRSGDDVVTDPASPPAETGLAPSPSDADSAPQGQPVFDRGNMSAVTVGGPGLVAVGSTGSAGAVWTSVDGSTWNRVPHDEAVFGGEGDPWISDVTVGGPGLVAVGAGGGVDGSDSVVWTSVDGITWSRVPHDEAVFGDAWISSVIAAGPGLVAVGSDNLFKDPDGDAAVWTSVDGVTWSRVPHDEAVFGGADNQNMLDVTVGGPGLVAVGRDGQNVWDYSLWQVAAVWTSVDGVTWNRVPHDEAVFGEADSESEAWVGQAMVAVTAGGPGLVAVGGETFAPSPFHSAVWTSVDGITWSRVPHDEEVFGTGASFWPMVDVSAVGPGLVAVGDAVWTSVDGITWSREPDDEPAFGTGWGVTAVGPGLVAVGSTGADSGVWTFVDGITWSSVGDDESTGVAD